MNCTQFLRKRLKLQKDDTRLQIFPAKNYCHHRVLMSSVNYPYVKEKRIPVRYHILFLEDEEDDSHGEKVRSRSGETLS